MPGTIVPDPSTLYAQLARLAAENLHLQARYLSARAEFLAQHPDRRSVPVDQEEFYDLLDQINRDFRAGRLSQREHDAEVMALVDAYERKAA